MGRRDLQESLTPMKCAGNGVQLVKGRSKERIPTMMPRLDQSLHIRRVRLG